MDVVVEKRPNSISSLSIKQQNIAEPEPKPLHEADPLPRRLNYRARNSISQKVSNVPKRDKKVKKISNNSDTPRKYPNYLRGKNGARRKRNSVDKKKSESVPKSEPITDTIDKSDAPEEANEVENNDEGFETSNNSSPGVQNEEKIDSVEREEMSDDEKDGRDSAIANSEDIYPLQEEEESTDNQESNINKLANDINLEDSGMSSIAAMQSSDLEDSYDKDQLRATYDISKSKESSTSDKEDLAPNGDTSTNTDKDDSEKVEEENTEAVEVTNETEGPSIPLNLNGVGDGLGKIDSYRSSEHQVTNREDLNKLESRVQEFLSESQKDLDMRRPRAPHKRVQLPPEENIPEKEETGDGSTEIWNPEEDKIYVYKYSSKPRVLQMKSGGGRGMNSISHGNSDPNSSFRLKLRDRRDRRISSRDLQDLPKWNPYFANARSLSPEGGHLVQDGQFPVVKRHEFREKLEARAKLRRQKHGLSNLYSSNPAMVVSRQHMRLEGPQSSEGGSQTESVRGHRTHTNQRVYRPPPGIDAQTQVYQEELEEAGGAALEEVVLSTLVSKAVREAVLEVVLEEQAEEARVSRILEDATGFQTSDRHKSDSPKGFKREDPDGKENSDEHVEAAAEDTNDKDGDNNSEAEESDKEAEEEDKAEEDDKSEAKEDGRESQNEANEGINDASEFGDDDASNTGDGVASNADAASDVEIVGSDVESKDSPRDY